MTELEITKLIKKHLNFSLFLAIAPMLFIYVINFMSGNEQAILILLAPIITLSAAAFFVKSVLLDAFANRSKRSDE